jgi:hypothetical protein
MFNYHNNDNSNDKDGNHYNSDHKDKEAPRDKADDSPKEDSNACKACLLCGVTCINKDYGRGKFVRYHDTLAHALAVLKDVELQASTFIVFHFLVCPSRFYMLDPPICAICLKQSRLVLTL